MSADSVTTAAPVDVDPALRDGYEVHQAALSRGLDVLLLPRQVMMVTAPDGKELSFVHGIPSTSTLSAVTFAQDKRVRRARLVEEGLPVPKGGTFSIQKGVGDAKRLIRKMGYPVVIKPAMGDNVIEVHAGLYDEVAVDEAINYLRTHVEDRPTYVKAAFALTLLGDPAEADGRLMVPRSYRVLVEKQVFGQYLRFLVIGDRVASVAHCPDGPQGLATGVDVTGEVHPSLATMAMQATKAISGLAVAAVDIVAGNFRREASAQDVSIVEFSERPWLVAQAAISDSLSRSLGDAILTDHAAEASARLDAPGADVAVELRAEGLSNANEALPALERLAAELGIDAKLAVTDAVEGVVDGSVTGSAGHLAVLGELLMDGRCAGHKAMLVQERVVKAGRRYG